jgi:hypothetical protein
MRRYALGGAVNIALLGERAGIVFTPPKMAFNERKRG